MTPEEFKALLFQHHLTRIAALASSSAGAYASPTEWGVASSSPQPHPSSQPTPVKQQLNAAKKQTVAHERHQKLKHKSDDLQLNAPVFTITVGGDVVTSDKNQDLIDEDLGADDGDAKDSMASLVAGTDIRSLPESLDEAMEDMEERRLLYMTFRDLFVSSAETLESLAYGTKELIPAGTKWFMDAWVQYPLLDNQDFIFRTEIFGSMKRLLTTLNATHPPPANRDLVKRQIKSALVLENAIDLVKTLLVDVEGWKEPQLIQIAWTQRNRNSSGDDEVAYREVSEEIERCIEKVTEKLLRLPFHEPRPVDEDRLSNYISDSRSRSDGYCLLLSLLETQAMHIASQRKAKLKVTKDGTAITQGISFARKKTTIVADAVAHVAFAKIQWIFGFLETNSFISAFAYVDIYLYKDDPKSVKQHTFVKVGHIPLFGSTTANAPYFWKLLQLKKRKDTAPQVNSSSPSEADLNSEDSLVKELKTVKQELEDVVASVEEIWFQVEPNVERIAVKPMSNFAEKYSDEVLVSVQHGTMHLTRKELIWSSSRIVGAASQGDTEPGIKIKHSSIIRFTSGKLDAPRPQGGGVGLAITSMSTALLPNVSLTNASSAALPGPSPEKAQAANGGMSVVTGVLKDGPMPSDHRASTASNIGVTDDGKPSFSKKMSLRFLSQQVKKKSYHIDIHTHEEVFKFYPFYDDEAQQMIASLSTVTGIVPFKDEEFIQSVLCKKLELTRRQALGYLAEEDNPWIEHSADLAMVIEALTAENQPQRIMDMERLFHSCRIEIEVTKEAIYLLRASAMI